MLNENKAIIKYLNDDDNKDFISSSEVRDKYTDNIIFCLIQKLENNINLYKPLAIIDNPDGYNWFEVSNNTFKKLQKEYKDYEITRLHGYDFSSTHRVNI